MLCKVPPAQLDNASPATRAAARADYIANGRDWQHDWEVFLALDTYVQVGSRGTWRVWGSGQVVSASGVGP